MPRALISETDVELKREGSLDRANGREGKRVGSHARDHEHKKKLREKLYGRKRFPRVRFSTEEPRKINAPKDESYLINTAVLFQEIDANEKVAHTRANKLPPGNSSSETREKFDFQFTNTTDGIKSDSIDTKTVVSSVSTSYKVTESFPSNETIVKMVSKALNESPKNITTSLKKPDPLTKYQIKSNFSRRRNNFRPTTKPKQDNVEKVQNLTAAPAEKNSQLDYQELVTVNERGAEQKNVTQGTEVGSRQSSVRLSGQKEGISRKIIPLSSRLKNVVKIPPKPRQAPVPNTSSIPTTISTHVSTILPAETTTAPTVRRRFTPRSRTSVPRRFRKSNDTNKNVTASEKFQKVEASSNVPSTSSMPELQKKPRRSKKFRRKHKDTKTESKPDAETGKDVGVDTRPRLEPSISADRPDAPPTMPPVQKFVETAPTHDKDSVGKIIMVIRNENEYGRVDGMINKANSTENRKTQQIENNSNLRPHQRVSKAPIIDIKIESTANPSNSEKSVRKFKRRGSFPHSGIIVKAGTATVEKVVGRNSNIVQALSPISSLITLTTESNVVEAPLIVTKKPALPSQATISQPITTTDKVRAYTAGRKVSLFGADYPDEGVARVIASPMPASTNYSRTSNLNSVNSLKESQGILTNSRGRRRHSVGSDASKKQDDEQGSSNSSNVRRRRYFRPMVSHDLTLTSAIMMEDNSVDSSAKMSLSEESTSSLLALPSQQVAIVTVDEYQPSANAHPEAQPVRPMVGDGYKSGKGVIKNRGGTETREGAWAEDNQRGYYKKSGSAPEHHSAHQAEKDKDFKVNSINIQKRNN
ncbi:uncharacterized protein LOC125177653 [Hyalella azteca]|uniref:Uncharacterized protein LOC125177653 n=1 Tax=Hyalella azteca TaxID=294128 RepID=A0A979FG92_HYAAZ|nr:uncharacterized protein LOC125177653 [Hyalella azteca]